MRQGDEIPLVGPNTAMTETLLVMTSKSAGCVGIVDGDGGLAGIITDGDLRRHIGGDMLSLDAGEVMTPAPKTIRPQALAAEALGRMNAAEITTLFVVENGKPVGLIHMHDCLRAGVA